MTTRCWGSIDAKVFEHGGCLAAEQKTDNFPIVFLEHVWHGLLASSEEDDALMDFMDTFMDPFDDVKFYSYRVLTNWLTQSLIEEKEQADEPAMHKKRSPSTQPQQDQDRPSASWVIKLTTDMLLQKIIMALLSSAPPSRKDGWRP